MERDAEVVGLEEDDDLLQVIALLATDANTVALNGDLQFAAGVLDLLHDGLGLLLIDPLEQFDGLPHPLAAGRLHLAVVEVAEGNAPLDELALEDVDRGLNLLGCRGVDDERLLLLLVLDDGVGVLEVVAGLNLAACLVDGVGDLLEVEFGDGVEGGHCVTP